MYWCGTVRTRIGFRVRWVGVASTRGKGGSEGSESGEAGDSEGSESGEAEDYEPKRALSLRFLKDKKEKAGLFAAFSRF